MIPEETISRVRESVNLVELIRESVPGLKKSGRNFMARCPFHQERTPSFNVNPEMGLFKCFGCGVGGDVFKFLMLSEGLSYPEAIRKVAGRVGIAVEDEAQRQDVSEETKKKQLLYGLLDDAATFYHRQLLESPEAKPVLDYLTKRGLSSESLEKFSIGFAPSSGNALRDAAARKGFSPETLESAGLIRRKEGSGRTYDHFWNRIIFPIWDAQGRLVAFGGRALGDAMPKYINSPETPIYSKSRHLYGLFQALPTLRKRHHLVVLEGYMDVAVCHQFGFDYTVATLGTALTDEHIRLLRRYVDHVTLLFDPDAAGAAATLRGGELLIAEGLKVDVVTLPDELDPDELLLRGGAKELEVQLQNPVPFMDYFIAQSLKRHPGTLPEHKLAVAKDVLPLIGRMRDPLLQDEHLGRLAEALRTQKLILAQQMKRMPKEYSEKTEKVLPRASEEKQSVFLSLEEEILLAAILYPSGGVCEMLELFEWQDARCRSAWKVLKTRIGSGTLNLSDALPALPDDISEWITRLALQTREYAQPLDVMRELLGAWRRQQETTRLREMKPEIDRMINGQIPVDTQRVQTYNDLSRKLKGSKSNPAGLV
ncbi:MAG: DNA primase [Elusimicrobiota bacterium]|jgi:DNA primase